MSASVLRYDFAPITGCETTEEGYLRVWCRAARTGTQVYTRADGSQVREYRPEEEVGKPESLSTFGMKPATWGHPPVLLDSDNTKKFQIGYSGSQVRYNDGFVEVAVVVTDKDAIDRIKRKDATEVSAGYKVDYDPTPGLTPGGESYDGVQRNIRVNHLAIVPRGRAGPEVRLLMDRMDAADAVAIDSLDLALQPKPHASPVMATVKLDGLVIDIPAEAATAVQSFARDMTRQLQAVTDERDSVKARLDALQEDVETLAYEKETADQQVADLQTRIDSMEASSSESRIDTAEIDRLIAERLDAFRHLAPAFDDDYKFDGVDTETLYSQAFTNLTGKEAPEGSDNGYIKGVVDGILTARADAVAAPEADADEADEEEEAEEEDRIDHTEEFRKVINVSAKNMQRNDAVSSYRAKQADAWKRPLTAHK